MIAVGRIAQSPKFGDDASFRTVALCYRNYQRALIVTHSSGFHFISTFRSWTSCLWREIQISLRLHSSFFFFFVTGLLLDKFFLSRKLYEPNPKKKLILYFIIIDEHFNILLIHFISTLVKRSPIKTKWCPRLINTAGENSYKPLRHHENLMFCPISSFYMPWYAELIYVL